MQFISLMHYPSINVSPKQSPKGWLRDWRKNADPVSPSVHGNRRRRRRPNLPTCSPNFEREAKGNGDPKGLVFKTVLRYLLFSLNKKGSGRHRNIILGLVRSQEEYFQGKIQYYYHFPYKQDGFFLEPLWWRRLFLLKNSLDPKTFSIINFPQTLWVSDDILLSIQKLTD